MQQVLQAASGNACAAALGARLRPAALLLLTCVRYLLTPCLALPPPPRSAATPFLQTMATAPDRRLLMGVNVLGIAYHNAGLEHERLGRLREAHVCFTRWVGCWVDCFWGKGLGGKVAGWILGAPASLTCSCALCAFVPWNKCAPG